MSWYDSIDFQLIWEATLETLQMIMVSTGFTVLFGLPLGILLFIISPGQILESRKLYNVIATLVNILRSIPFIIILVIAMPLTRIITGTTIGVPGVIPPLVISATPYFARLVQNIVKEMDMGIVEACKSMGATTWQTVKWAILPEVTSPIIGAVTVTAISIVGYTAMAGVVGGGGLGDVAIRFGYNRFEPVMLWSTVPILVIIVQVIQYFGDKFMQRYNRRSN